MAITLYDDQQEAMNQMYAWLENNEGNLCIEMPTGSGKSFLVAAICRDALKVLGMKKVVMLVHVKELIEQNAEKMRLAWPGAPLGIFSASIGRKEHDEPIVFAGIQSIYKKPELLGHVDRIIVDECDLISHKDEGIYRSFIGALLKVNPTLRVIGLTATPYRAGHGLITDKPAIFDAIIKPVSLEELINKGRLATIRSKNTTLKIDVSGVRLCGGDYAKAELQDKVDKKDQNAKIVSEVIARAGDRKSWLFFCAGTEHAEHMAEELRLQGIPSECVTHKTSKTDREKTIQRLRSGELRSVTNYRVLSVGVDCPDLDLLVLAGPTKSVRLYMQMIGRILRLKKHTDHGLVLDFAGLVATHGPITKVQPPKKAGKGNGEAPVKLCDNCSEICHAAARVCTCCGYQFPPPKEKELFLHGDCIMGIENSQAFIEKWSFQPHMTVKNIECILVKYFLKGKKTPLPEYLLVYHPGWVGQDANRTLRTIASKTIGMAQLDACQTISEVVRAMNKAKCPAVIEYKAAGKYPKITERLWHGTSNI